MYSEGKLFEKYESFLKKKKSNFIILSGSIEERKIEIKKALDLLN